MRERLQNLANGAILVLIVGWFLHAGKAVLVPIAFSVFVVYVVVGLARLIGKVPVLGRVLPPPIRYLLATFAMAIVFVEVMYLVVASKDAIAAFAPRVQERILAVIHTLASHFSIESEPTWATLRQDLLAQIDLQKFLRSLFASVASTLVSIEIVVLYASFLLFERRTFAAKLASLSGDSHRAARARRILDLVSVRIGSYLALKTVLGALLGVMCWIAMTLVGLESAAFWAVLIGLLNYIPYVGPALGIALPVTMAAVQFGSPADAFVLLLALLAIYAFVGYLLDPYAMGASLNLSPFAMLVSLTIWAELWGIPGAFVAIPMTTILAIALSEFPGTRPIAVFLSRDGRV
jgi:AI-2 transport protein TqsA